MTSLLTNASAMTALQTLSLTNKNLATTQNRIATGEKVSQASDNAAYWSIATTMRSDNKANAVIGEALGLGQAKVDTAYTAMNDALEVVDQIKEKVLLAKSSTTDERAKIQTEISALQAHLKDSIGGSSYAGTNVLKTDSTGADKLSILSSYNRDGTTVTTGTIDIDYENTRLIDSDAAAAGILDKDGDTSGIAFLDIDVSDVSGVTGYDAADDSTVSTAFDNLLTDIESALKSMGTGAAELGAAKARIDLQVSFNSKLQDSIDRGIGALVDADMNAESARLSALQTQQQLGIQALSIANQSSQNILSLFR